MLASQALVTLLEAALGLALGGALAVALGALMAASRAAERGLYPLAIQVKLTPAIALAPLLIAWLGFGPAPKVVVAALISFFPFLVGTISGLRAAEPGALEVARSLGASAAETFLAVRLPWALPHLFAALRVSASLALIGAMVAEWLGADRGLGHLVMQANANLDMPGLFAAVVVLAALGALLNLCIGAAERRALDWHPAGRQG
jgi:NitT/TauT family transport system permease protein